MEFAFTEEQEQLRREVRSLLEGREPSWKELAELGWLGVSVPEAHGGAGLGLSIVRSIVEAHGGAIKADASKLGGLAVSIELPALA